MRDMTPREQSHTTPFGLKYQLERNLRPFNRDEIRRLPKDHTGVYALWLPTETKCAYDCLYVGMSDACVHLETAVISDWRPETNRNKVT